MLLGDNDHDKLKLLFELMDVKMDGVLDYSEALEALQQLLNLPVGSFLSRHINKAHKYLALLYLPLQLL